MNASRAMPQIDRVMLTPLVQRALRSATVAVTD
jgi:hypothetical protein